jgi:hypothetical protein
MGQARMLFLSGIATTKTRGAGIHASTLCWKLNHGLKINEHGHQGYLVD